MPPYAPERPPLPLPLEGRGSFAYWKGQLQAAEDKREEYKTRDWDKNVQAYLGQTLEAVPTHDTIVVPKDFANVERKKAELYFQNPEVTLRPKMPGLEDAVFKFQAVLNQYLGPDGVDAATMMAECTFDACMTGFMCSKIGYEAFEDGEVPIGPEPPPSLLGLNPEPQMVPNIIHERYFWERISPAKTLMPVNFSGFNYDRAPWLAFEFEDDDEVLQHKYHLKDDLPGGGSGEDDHRLKGDRFETTASRDLPKRRRGWEIWYRASLYDPSVVHPDVLRYLVILEGFDEPVLHTESPYQSLDPQTGKLTGLKGYPIHIGAVRYVSDSAYPVAETTMSRNQVQELSKSRTQMILQRDRNAPMRFVDIQRIGGQPGLDKLEKNVWQAWVPVSGLDVNQPPALSVAQSSYPPEDFTFDRIISRDLDEVWAFGSNQRGLETTERKTATEIRNIQNNVTARLDYERRQIIRYFVRGAEKLGALVQKFAGPTAYVEILGEDGTRRLEAWNKDQIQGEFVYDARPDSAVRVDTAQEFRDLMEFYTLAARDPHVNRVELLLKLARLRNLDPSRFLIAQLPEKQPDAPTAGLSLKGEDLLPTNPHFPIVIELLQQGGWKISPQAIQAAQQHAQLQGQIMNAVGALGPPPAPTTGQISAGPDRRHPGAQPQAESLSKHTGDRSNELSGPSTKT